MTSRAEVLASLDAEKPRGLGEIADDLRCAREVVLQHLKASAMLDECRCTSKGWLLQDKPEPKNGRGYDAKPAVDPPVIALGLGAAAIPITAAKPGKATPEKAATSTPLCEGGAEAKPAAEVPIPIFAPGPVTETVGGEASSVDTNELERVLFTVSSTGTFQIFVNTDFLELTAAETLAFVRFVELAQPILEAAK